MSQSQKQSPCPRLMTWQVVFKTLVCPEAKIIKPLCPLSVNPHLIFSMSLALLFCVLSLFEESQILLD